jgi:hypothetical protein
LVFTERFDLVSFIIVEKLREHDIAIEGSHTDVAEASFSQLECFNANAFT